VSVHGDLVEECNFESDGDFKEFFMSVPARREAPDRARGRFCLMFALPYKTC
jgi:hypothetical protein